jgi:hypothetical protein
MIWYAFQTAVVYWVINYCTNLHTHASTFAIVLVAFFAAYLLTAVLSLFFDLLGWLFTGGSLPADPLLRQQSRNHLGVHISQKVLPTSRPEHR